MWTLVPYRIREGHTELVVVCLTVRVEPRFNRSQWTIIITNGMGMSTIEYTGILQLVTLRESVGSEPDGVRCIRNTENQKVRLF